MKKFKEIREGFVSAAQRKAVHAAKADGGKGHPDNKKKAKKEDAVSDFLAKGGKIKKLPPAKAQGYHGKDDPGKGMAGMMDKGDTKAIGTRKKVKSMEATQVDEISKDTKKSYIKKAADDMSKQADRMARAQRGDGKMDKAVNKFVNRRKGIARAVENFQVQKYTDGKKDGPAKSFGGNLKKATAHASAMKKAGKGDHRVHKEANAAIKELTHDTMNKYYDKAKKSKDKATNSAVATIMRKGDHSQDLKTRDKRIKGMELAKTRSIKKIRGDK